MHEREETTNSTTCALCYLVILTVKFNLAGQVGSHINKKNLPIGSYICGRQALVLGEIFLLSCLWTIFLFW